MKLPISGLMCIPPVDEDPISHFAKLKTLARDNNLDQLSIGMSGIMRRLYNSIQRTLGLGQFYLVKENEKIKHIFK